MADYFGAAQSLFGGASSLFGGLTAASGSRAAAAAYDRAASLTKLETGIKQLAADRQIYQTLGGARADVAANGFKLSGSAADVLRSSASQGALTKALIDLQGDITVNSFEAQAENARALAKSQSVGGFLGAIGNLAGAAASIFSDDRLKTEVSLVETRDDGIHLYRYRYAGSEHFYIGVLASEVEHHRPDAVSESSGYRMVDYGKLGLQLKRAA